MPDWHRLCLIVLLLLLLLYVFYHVHIGGREAPPLYPFEDSEISLWQRSRFGGTGLAFSLEIASFALAKKFSEAPRALRSRFFARLGCFGARTCSPEGFQDAPGFDFGARNGGFFEVFACGKRSTSKTSNIEKTL